MYAAFNFIADRQEDFLQNNIMNYQKSGQNIVSQKTDEAKDTLRQYLNNGIINGSKLSEDWFPSVSSDVFISYSHDDADIAMALTGYLEKTFGLKVFVDSIYWDSADGLLRQIDEKYCLNKYTGRFNYTKRNYSTSHVHAMLSTAILKTMDKSEAIFFINTDKSIIPEAKASIEEAEKIEESEGSYTRSPWLFEEIMFASLIQKKHGKAFRTDEAVFNESARDLPPFEAKYEVPLEDMTTLSVTDLSRWENSYSSNRINGLSNLKVAHPLLSLYDLKFQKKVQQGVRQPIW